MNSILKSRCVLAALGLTMAACGVETMAQSESPVSVPITSEPVVTHLELGYWHSFAVTAQDQAMSWGHNGYGQLGGGSASPFLREYADSAPVFGPVVDVAAGGGHTCVVDVAGAQNRLSCVGDNDFGQMGNGTAGGPAQVTPTPVLGIGPEKPIAVAAGESHTCAIVQDAQGRTGVKCWGDNSYGQMGTGSKSGPVVQAGWVPGLGLGSGVTVIGAGNYHTCAAYDRGLDRGAVCWGSDIFCQLGRGQPTCGGLTAFPPVTVSGLQGKTVVSLGAGAFHSCAVRGNGSLWCWGANPNGELGDGTRTTRSSATAVATMQTGVSAVAGGLNFTCAVQSGAAKCWGDNAYGQLGNGDLSGQRQLLPSQVDGLTSDVTAIGAGYYHGCAALARGAACWGPNPFGQLGDDEWGNGIYEYSPVSVVWR